MSGETIVTVVGNLTADPETRTVGTNAVANFTVASTPRIFDKASGEWQDSPDTLFMRCSIWRDAAEHVSESLEKGARVIVTGRLKQRSYEKDGQTRTVVELEVDEIGPSLKYATAKVLKVQRSNGGSAPAKKGKAAPDPWGEDAPF